MSKYRRKCFCTANLKPDGTCRWGCDQALRQPAMRRAHAQMPAKKREREAFGVVGLYIKTAEARAGFQRAVPDRLRVQQWNERKKEKLQ